MDDANSSLERNSMRLEIIAVLLISNSYASQPNPELNKSFHKLPLIKYTRLELEMIEKETKKLEEAKQRQEKKS